MNRVDARFHQKGVQKIRSSMSYIQTWLKTGLELLHLYHLCDAFVLPSRGEGWCALFPVHPSINLHPLTDLSLSNIFIGAARMWRPWRWASPSSRPTGPVRGLVSNNMRRAPRIFLHEQSSISIYLGPTEFITQANAYPLRIEGLTEIQAGPFKVRFFPTTIRALPVHQ